MKNEEYEQLNLYELFLPKDRRDLYLEVSQGDFQRHHYRIKDLIRLEVAESLAHKRCMQTILKKLDIDLQRLTPNGARNHEVPSLRMVAIDGLKKMESGKIPTCPIILAVNHEEEFQRYFRTLCRGRKNHGITF